MANVALCAKAAADTFKELNIRESVVGRIALTRQRYDVAEVARTQSYIRMKEI
eukprot:CAMPEP_0184403818 /NCGR_PEP_ID=MMETSP0007-20130409/85617_1 /TAXON_ID=97485 /ORGANISM="Prymnesium parvum, Strain Texoma1" /LENGTH=52 /DNA_ID=CAMNT_0026759949 /DNA_START=273 /DNA_END=431 /DNA_ORIENTATION=+